MLSSLKTMSQRRRKILLISALLLACALLPHLVEGGLPCLEAGEPAALRCIVNHNVGYGHFTRGMNMQTIEGLDRESKFYDMPILQEMLFDDDRITAMTAAEVLKRKGKPGRAMLLQGFHRAENAGDKPRAALINEYGELHLQVN